MVMAVARRSALHGALNPYRRARLVVEGCDRLRDQRVVGARAYDLHLQVGPPLPAPGASLGGSACSRAALASSTCRALRAGAPIVGDPLGRGQHDLVAEERH